MFIETSPTSNDTCYICQNPIVKNEGRGVWADGRLYCYYCTVVYIKEWIEFFESELKELNDKTKIGEQKMLDIKLLMRL